jgi:membrane protein implicated in regulation of membrane protease activity
MRQQSSIRNELAALGIFLLMFVVITYLMLRFIVPLHFNDRVAIMIAAILASVSYVALRAWIAKRRA